MCVCVWHIFFVYFCLFNAESSKNRKKNLLVLFFSQNIKNVDLRTNYNSAFTVTTPAPSFSCAPTAFPSFLLIDPFLQSSSALMSCFPSASRFILLFFLPTLDLLASWVHHSSAGSISPSGLCAHSP